MTSQIASFILDIRCKKNGNFWRFYKGADPVSNYKEADETRVVDDFLFSQGVRIHECKSEAPNDL